ncbi:DUF5590 domain-containing protein [Bacillus kexueae]|uniref:cell wall elongation regulator TseB-like domain-containing protein n=1 Tax=Aeribacillus kexueae TaxID=2078952 RepID=UPI001FB00A83|nr:DUF5590 domain-containing protein [Bacillus kexueae]
MNRKGIITLSIIIIITLITTTVALILRSALEHRTDGHAYAEQKAIENGIKNIEEVSTYRSDSVYYVVKGKNKNDEQVVAFVPKEEKEQVHIFLEKDGLTKEEVLELVHRYDEEKRPNEIISIQLGFDNSQTPKWDIPVWEVRYKDQKNRYTYFIVSFTDPKVYKSYSIQQ